MLVVAVLGLLAVCSASVNPYKRPDPRCKHLGQFLNDGYDSCSYLVCGYGNEPWKDAYGNIAFFTDRQHCAPGTAVSKGYYGGYGNPCSEASYECNPPVKHYQEPSYGYSDNSYSKQNTGYDSHNTGYDNTHNTGYGNTHNSGSGYGNTHNSGYGNSHNSGSGYGNTHNSGYGNTHSSGYDNTYNSGYGNTHNSGYGNSHNSGYDSNNRGYGTQTYSSYH